MEVNVHEAKTQLSKLIAAAERGEDVLIARAGKAVVKLVAVKPPSTESRKSMVGAGIGKIWIADDFDSPETNREIQTIFEGGGEGGDGLR